MRFYVFAPGFFLRPKNTDWLYNRTLPQVSQFDPRVEVYLQGSFLKSVQVNARTAAGILKSRAKLPIPEELLPEFESSFSLRDLRRSQADLVYGHSPTNVTHLPLICHTGPVFEEEMRARGVSETIIQREKDIKQRTIERSQLITLHSQVGADTIRAIAGPRADRVRVLPFFLPHLSAIDRKEVEGKYAEIASGGRIRFLFVGREARRKGLEWLLPAFEKLDSLFRGRLELEIISTFADGPVQIPKLPNVSVRGETPRNEVKEKMHRAHIFLMPSRFETFGWVYLEALGAGAVTLAADLPTQREILADGQAGLLVPQSADAIVKALEPLLNEPSRMLALALAGLERMKSAYDPHSVARQFYEVGLEAQELFRRDQRST